MKVVGIFLFSRRCRTLTFLFFFTPESHLKADLVRFAEKSRQVRLFFFFSFLTRRELLASPPFWPVQYFPSLVGPPCPFSVDRNYSLSPFVVEAFLFPLVLMILDGKRSSRFFRRRLYRCPPFFSVPPLFERDPRRVRTFFLRSSDTRSGLSFLSSP